MEQHQFIFPEPFQTETGETLSGLCLRYHTLGHYEAGKSKVVWICHALTASGDVADWWPELVGPGKFIDPERFFIICVNIPSSCYGSTGPLSIHPETGKPYYKSFPFFTIRDIVRSFMRLREALGIPKIDLLMGGSMGGYQAVEWAIMETDRIEQLMLIATSASESAWGVAIHTAQRIAIEADPSFGENRDNAGAAGLKAARAIGMLTYRSYGAFVSTQSDPDLEKIENFRASSYIHYQGEKLVKRFNAYSYWLLTKTMDSHNVARGRGSLAAALKKIKARTLCIAISTDMLCPKEEQVLLAEKIPGAVFREIDSPFGHDGFLVEGKKIGVLLAEFLS